MKRFLAWLTGGHSALRVLDDAEREAYYERMRQTGAIVLVCPHCGSHTWSRFPGVSERDVAETHFRAVGCDGLLPD